MIEYRDATPADGPELDALAQAVWKETFERFYTPGDLNAYLTKAYGPDGELIRHLADPAVRFHLAILDATNNPILRSFRGAIEAILSAMFDFTVDVFAGNLANHAAVLDAIAAGEADRAREAMRQVLGYTRGHMLSSPMLAGGEKPRKSEPGETS